MPAVRRARRPVCRESPRRRVVFSEYRAPRLPFVLRPCLLPCLFRPACLSLMFPGAPFLFLPFLFRHARSRVSHPCVLIRACCCAPASSRVFSVGPGAGSVSARCGIGARKGSWRIDSRPGSLSRRRRRWKCPALKITGKQGFHRSMALRPAPQCGGEERCRGACGSVLSARCMRDSV